MHWRFLGCLLYQSDQIDLFTFGVKFPIDVAYCDSSMCVVRTASVNPNRLCLPVFRASSIVEAEAGSFARWGLRPGDVLEVRL